LWCSVKVHLNTFPLADLTFCGAKHHQAQPKCPGKKLSEARSSELALLSRIRLATDCEIVISSSGDFLVIFISTVPAVSFFNPGLQAMQLSWPGVMITRTDLK
jgi:hypothetical protein